MWHKATKFISPHDYLTTAAVAKYSPPSSTNDESNSESISQSWPWSNKHLDSIVVEYVNRDLLKIERLKLRAAVYPLKFMLKIEPIVFPIQVSACPTLESTQNFIQKENIIVNVFSYNGKVMYSI
jgi:hypothetical protein